MEKALNKLNKTELKEIVEKEGIVITEAEDLKNIINAEYVAAIEKHRKSKPKKVKPKILTKEEQVQDLYRQIPVVISYHDNGDSIEDDEAGRVWRGAWGNGTIGMRTFSVRLDGAMQYLEIGAIKKLKTLQFPYHTQDANNKPTTILKNKFTITETDGWTEEELTARKKSQAVRTVST